MAISKATARWEGTLKEGKGTMKPANAPEAPYSLGTRFEGKPGSSPEEMIGAALAGCYSMALSKQLGAEGFTPKSIQTSATVHLEKVGEGFSITRIELDTEVRATGGDEAKFKPITEATKKGCPVSKALAGTEITLTAKLVSA